MQWNFKCIQWVLYTFLEHFHTHYFNQLIQQLLAYNRDSRNYRILPKIIQVVGTTGTKPRLHDWSDISTGSQASKGVSVPLLSPQVMSSHSLQSGCLSVRNDSCRYKFQREKKYKSFFDKHYRDIKIKVAFFFIASLHMSFPDAKALLGDSSSTWYFYVHIIPLSNSRAFTPGNHLLNIPHCLTAWPVHFFQT